MNLEKAPPYVFSGCVLDLSTHTSISGWLAGWKQVVYISIQPLCVATAHIFLWATAWLAISIRWCGIYIYRNMCVRWNEWMLKKRKVQRWWWWKPYQSKNVPLFLLTYRRPGKTWRIDLFFYTHTQKDVHNYMQLPDMYFRLTRIAAPYFWYYFLLYDLRELYNSSFHRPSYSDCLTVRAIC